MSLGRPGLRRNRPRARVREGWFAEAAQCTCASALHMPGWLETRSPTWTRAELALAAGCKVFDGSVESGSEREDGQHPVSLKTDSPLFAGLAGSELCLLTHGDSGV